MVGDVKSSFLEQLPADHLWTTTITKTKSGASQGQGRPARTGRRAPGWPTAATELARVLALEQQLQESVGGVLARTRRRAPSGIRRAKDYVDQHLTEPLTRGGLARYAGLSVSVFSRQWNHVVGLSVPEYLAQQRVERAKALLRETDHKVLDLAFAVGFQSLPAFYRAFTAQAGQSPADYRRRGGGNPGVHKVRQKSRRSEEPVPALCATVCAQ